MKIKRKAQLFQINLPTCLYTSTKVCIAASLTGPLGSLNRFTIDGINAFSDSSCVPYLHKIKTEKVFI